MAFELLQFLKSYIYKPYIPPFFLSPSCTKYRQKHTGGTRRKISGYLKTFHLINFRVGRQWENQPWHTEADYLKTWGRENTRRPSSAAPSLADYPPCMGSTPADTCRPPEREQPHRATLKQGWPYLLPQTLPDSLPALPPDNCQAARHQPPTLGLPYPSSPCKPA